MFALLLYALAEDFPFEKGMPFFCSATVIFFFGVLDDFKNLSAAFRSLLRQGRL